MILSQFFFIQIQYKIIITFEQQKMGNQSSVEPRAKLQASPKKISLLEDSLKIYEQHMPVYTIPSNRDQKSQVIQNLLRDVKSPKSKKPLNQLNKHVQKLYIQQKIAQQKIKTYKEQLKTHEINQCTFKPRINSPQSPKRNLQQFVLDQKRFLEKKEQSLKREFQKKKEKQQKQNPTIVSPKKFNPQVFARLYKQKISREESKPKSPLKTITTNPLKKFKGEILYQNFMKTKETKDQQIKSQKSVTLTTNTNPKFSNQNSQLIFCQRLIREYYQNVDKYCKNQLAITYIQFCEILKKLRYNTSEPLKNKIQGKEHLIKQRSKVYDAWLLLQENNSIHPTSCLSFIFAVMGINFHQYKDIVQNIDSIKQTQTLKQFINENQYALPFRLQNDQLDEEDSQRMDFSAFQENYQRGADEILSKTDDIYLRKSQQLLFKPEQDEVKSLFNPEINNLKKKLQSNKIKMGFIQNKARYFTDEQIKIIQGIFYNFYLTKLSEDKKSYFQREKSPTSLKTVKSEKILSDKSQLNLTRELDQKRKTKILEQAERENLIGSQKLLDRQEYLVLNKKLIDKKNQELKEKKEFNDFLGCTFSPKIHQDYDFKSQQRINQRNLYSPNQRGIALFNSKKNPPPIVSRDQQLDPGYTFKPDLSKGKVNKTPVYSKNIESFVNRIRNSNERNKSIKNFIQNRSIHKYSPPPSIKTDLADQKVLFVDIRIDDKYTERIEIKKGQKVQLIAKRFIQKHNLNQQTSKQLITLLQTNMNKLYQ